MKSDHFWNNVILVWYPVSNGGYDNAITVLSFLQNYGQSSWWCLSNCKHLLLRGVLMKISRQTRVWRWTSWKCKIEIFIISFIYEQVLNHKRFLTFDNQNCQKPSNFCMWHTEYNQHSQDYLSNKYHQWIL